MSPSPGPGAPCALGPLGLGTAALGNLFAAIGEEQAEATLAEAVAAGVRYFDTAPFYGHGLAERRLGAFFARNPEAGLRLSTKVGRTLVPAEPVAQRDGFVGADPARAIFDYSAGAVRRQVEASFARLGVASVDLLFIHDIGSLTHGPAHAERFRQARAGAFPELRELKAEGRTKGLGIGVNEIEVCFEVLDTEPIDAILLAGRYTLLEQGALPLLAAARARDVAVVIGGPFNSGVLAGGGHYDYASVPPHVAQRVQRLEAVCRRHGVELGAAALQFPLAHPAVAAVIPGARSPQEVAQHARWLGQPIPTGLWEDLMAAALLHPDAPVPSCA